MGSYLSGKSKIPTQILNANAISVAASLIHQHLPLSPTIGLKGEEVFRRSTLKAVKGEDKIYIYLPSSSSVYNDTVVDGKKMSREISDVPSADIDGLAHGFTQRKGVCTCKGCSLICVTRSTR